MLAVLHWWTRGTSCANGFGKLLRTSTQQWQPFATDSVDAYRICIVGSGPAGFYTADRVSSSKFRCCTAYGSQKLRRQCVCVDIQDARSELPSGHVGAQHTQCCILAAVDHRYKSVKRHFTLGHSMCRNSCRRRSDWLGRELRPTIQKQRLQHALLLGDLATLSARPSRCHVTIDV